MQPWFGVLYLMHYPGRGAYGSGSGVMFDIPADIAPGKHILQFKFSQRTESSRSGMMAFGRGTGIAPDPDDVVIERDIQVEVTAPEASTVELITLDSAAQKGMTATLEPLRVLVWSNEYGMYGRGPVSISFNIADLPIGGDFDVQLRSGDRAWDLGRLTTGKTYEDPWEAMYYYGYGSQRTVSGTAEGLSKDEVDVVLRPNAKSAARTLDLFRIYGDEIVYKNVEVTRPKPR